jgi:hypothetical protein
MAIRRRRKRTPPRRIWPVVGRVALWGLLIVETAWLVAFIWETGVWLPFGQTWANAQQRQLDEMRIEEILHDGASRGEQD